LANPKAFGGAAATIAAAVIPIFPDLEDKVAVVTGGSKGIGAATCQMLAANGVRVAVVARERQGIDALVSRVREAGGDAIGISADCRRLAQIENARHNVEREFGPTDIVMAFAGGFGRSTPFVEITEEEWHAVVESNLTSSFLTLKSFLPGMVDRQQGSVVTMASNVGRLLDILLTASYAAAKAGVVMLTRHTARELGPHNVRINCVAPATTISERVETILSSERIEEIAGIAPLGRIGVPEDTAAAALFLASEASRYLTGVTLDISGGRVML
jgi:3-oxoacyl-[acyl-carrier protein] reductase